MRHRIEEDALGRVNVPADAYYGSETQRNLDNFKISGFRLSKDFIVSYAILKKAAAKANMRTGKLDKRRGNAIMKACNEVIGGRLSDQFRIDAYQAGAGTSTNMNLNEVIANRAIEMLGGRKGDYRIVHPNDHVNMSQSTNDTFHSVIHITAHTMVKDRLLGSLDALERSLGRKSKEFSGIVKTGRTHLQDAVPMTLGEEFSGYEYAVKKVRMGIEEANERLLDIPLGGTAVGTGINASEEYSRFAISELNSMTRCGFRISENRFASMQNQTGELMMVDSLKDAAIVISKIAGDLRILGSGPRAGIHELLLPEIQPGSSIMPGKVNPSVCEMMIMVCFQAIGNSRVVEEGAMNGQLELDVFMPVIAFNLITSIEIMSNAVDTFNRLCVKGIRADEESIKKGLESNISLATALSPRIGYAKAAEIARRAYKTGKTVKQVCLDMGILDGEELDKVLDPKNMV